MALPLSCSPASAPSSALITKVGAYPSPGGTSTLHVSLDGSSVVIATIKETTTSKELFQARSGSKYHRWFFFWETDTRLWMQSSDLGIFDLLEKTPGGFVKSPPFKRGDPRLKTIPAEVKAALPNTTKRELGL